MNPDNSAELNLETRGRGGPGNDGPYCWQSRATLDFIKKSFAPGEGLPATQIAYARSIYLALSQIQSTHARKPIIEAAISKIADLAGLGYRKTAETLDDLEDVGVIRILRKPPRRGERRAVNRYILLGVNGSDGNISPQGTNTPQDADIGTNVYAHHADNIKGDTKEVSPKDVKKETGPALLAFEGGTPDAEKKTVNPLTDNSYGGGW
ncbi:MAG TPA: hypothetical protein VLT36_21720 [Candidatus Dormibacteraeota bacterium]|nr:hypothetical protein [Candidatus Dormibacteraeota bacterium]